MDLGLLWGAMALTSTQLISNCHGSPERSTGLSFSRIDEKPLLSFWQQRSGTVGCAQLRNVLPAGKLLWYFSDHLTSVATATSRL